MTAHARLAAAAAFLVSSMAAQAVVQTGGWSYGLDTSGVNRLTVQQSPSGAGGFYSVQTTYDALAGTLTFGSPTLGAPADFFVVTPGQVISGSTLADLKKQGTFANSVASGLFVTKDFYLGTATINVTDPEFSWATAATTRTIYGWAHLQVQANGTLQIVDSAMAFHEPGIKVGTLQAIPEPGTWALMGIGLVGLAAVRRRAQA